MTTLSTANRRRRDDGEDERSWSDLPDEPLHTILMRLCSLVDLISFKSVCRSWRAVASSLPPSVITSHFPPLLLAPATSHLYTLSRFRVFDPTSPSFFSSLSRNSDKFKLLDTICYSHGHLLGFLHNRIAIINLFTCGEFYSPILPKKLSNRMHRKGLQLTRYLLAAPLSSPHSGLLAFTNGPLLYWHIGSASWSYHWPKTEIADDLRIVTVQGKVYAMNPRDCSLYVLDFSPKLHLRPLTVEGIQKYRSVVKHFLVDCGGELLHVRLDEDAGPWVENEDQFVVYEDQSEENEDQSEENEDQSEENEDQFEENEDQSEENEEDCPPLEVFMLDLSVNGPRWVQKETLGNWAIFVGFNHHVPGIAVENPERWGGSSNCVYFATKNANGDSPWAAIKLGDRINIYDPESPLYIGYFGHLLSSAWVHPGC